MSLHYYHTEIIFLILTVCTERFTERNKFRHSQTEDMENEDMLLMNALNDPAEEAILDSVTEQGLDTIITEVKHILDITTVLMVRRDFSAQHLDEKLCPVKCFFFT